MAFFLSAPVLLPQYSPASPWAWRSSQTPAGQRSKRPNRKFGKKKRISSTHRAARHSSGTNAADHSLPPYSLIASTTSKRPPRSSWRSLKIHASLGTAAGENHGSTPPSPQLKPCLTPSSLSSLSPAQQQGGKAGAALLGAYNWFQQERRTGIWHRRGNLHRSNPDRRHSPDGSWRVARQPVRE
jgi:hypothetical protein